MNQSCKYALFFFSLLFSACQCAPPAITRFGPSPNPAAYSLGPILHADLLNDLSPWKIESEAPGTISAANGILSIEVPKGCTLWFKQELSGPLLIQYDARMIRALPPAAPGPNDRVSDLNCFWMATDPRATAAAPDAFLNLPARTGAFATYDPLKTYYVGQGGNTNSTTRFRRYIGASGNRPLLPEHDLTAPEFLLTPNTWQTLQLVADGNLIEYYRDGKRIFQYADPAPYTHGYFGIRTTWSHLEIRNMEIRRLLPTPKL